MKFDAANERFFKKDNFPELNMRSI